MTSNGIFQILLYTAVIIALAKPMGAFMAKVFAGERTWLHRFLRPVESAIYKTLRNRRNGRAALDALCRVSVLAFSAVSLLFTYLILRLQQWFPWNPAGLANVGEHLSWNTAVSFTSNTNWQSYVPESTMSYLSQMVALATHNFFSAAAGIAVAIAVIRGFSRHSTRTLGNFWVDFTRCTLYILLPLSVIAALLLCSQGVIQNLDPYAKVTTLEGTVQTIAQGPVASQEAIKMLGTNGGGFFNANSAHPYENPTPLANFLQMVLIFVIPRGPHVHLRQDGTDTRQGWALLAAMTILFLAGRLCRVSGGTGRQSGADTHGRGRRQHGRQGSALRHRQLGAFHRGHDRRKLRRGEQHARQPHAAGRPRAAGQYRAGRSCVRRRGIGLVRHVAVRHPGGIYRRPDGGPHAGVSREEDRAEGSQDGDARRDGAGNLHPRLFSARASGRPP